MQKVFTSILFSIMLLYSGPACAVETYCFGPRQYVHDKGNPVVYTDTFAARSGAARLEVVNGDADGGGRIRSARIVLNGTECFGAGDFNPQVDSLSADVHIEAQNTLRVELRSYAGNQGARGEPPHLTIAVVQDLPAPTAAIRIDPPVIVRGQSATLAWNCTEAESCTLAPGIGAVDPGGAVQVSPAETTRYTLTATGPGGTFSAEAILTVEPPALGLHITRPIDGAEIGSRLITVFGTVSPPDAGVAVNGTPALVTEGMFVAENIALNAGDNTLTAVAQSGAERIEDSVTVHVPGIDLEPYALELVASSRNDRNLKMEGLARVTVLNHGTGDVTVPYHLALFEDTNLNGRFDPDDDNRLAEIEVASGPVAGGSKDLLIEFTGLSLFRDNRLAVAVDPLDAVEETDENNNLRFTPRSGVDVSASYLRVDHSLCPEQALLSVRIGNAGAVELAAGLAVSFYRGDPASTGTRIGTAFTARALLPGEYEDLRLAWPDTAALQPVFAVADDDGSGRGIYAESDEDNNRTSAPVPVCSASQGVSDSISGLALDAASGSVLDGVRISLYTDADGVPGTMLQQATTPAGGGFGFADLSPGSYIVGAALDGYIDSHRKVTLGSGQILTRQDLVLSPLLGPDEMRIVLTWGEHPQDLEAHLTGPNPDGCRHHCSYWNRRIPGAVLNADDTDGFGPETITLTKGAPGAYRFYVHDFSNRYSKGSMLSSSGARVVVYDGLGEAPRTFEVPPLAGTVWHVFDVDGQNGRVNPIDRMAFQSEPGKIDFPVITSTPVTTLIWGFPYGYELTVLDPDPDPLAFTLLKAPPGMTLDPQSGVLQWSPDAWQGGSHEVAVRVSDGRCGQDTQSFHLNVSFKPAVTFGVTPCSGVNPEGPITLTWDTHRAETVTISPGIGPVAPSGSLTIASPEASPAYTLTARNAVGTTTRQVPGWPSAHISVDASVADRELNWNASCAAECYISPDIGAVPCSGSRRVAAAPGTYTLTARNGTGTATAATTECTRPAIGFSTQPVCEWFPGDPVVLKLSGPECVGLCQIDGGVGAVPCEGSIEVRPTAPTAYTLTAVSGEDSLTRSLTAPVILPPAIIDSGAHPAAIRPGESAMLFWSTDCAQACLLEPGIGEVAAKGSLVVAPDELPKSYTLTALRGSESAVRTITITHVKPVVSFYAAPGVIKPGESATLTWSVEDATACRIEPDIGPVPASGSIAVEPSQRTTYTLTAEGPGGAEYGSTTVSFVRPTARIQAEPEVLQPGESTTLSWIYTDADTCRIEPGIGEVALGGSLTLTPDKATVYTITATGPGGSVSDSVHVRFAAPSVTISADPQSIGPGQSTTLSWNSNFADSCSLSPAVGAVPPNGSMTVSPAVSTTYTITATGPGGNAQASVTVKNCAEPVVAFEVAPQVIRPGQAAVLTWHVENAETVWIYSFGEMPASGSKLVSPSMTTQYTLRLYGSSGPVIATATLELACPPSLSFLEPDGIGDRVDTRYVLKWKDADCDSNAAIAIYYDTDDSGADGTLIVSGLFEDPDGDADRLLWDTSALPEGVYFVYAVIDDGRHAPVTVYAGYPVTIDHSAPPLSPITLSPHDGATDDLFGYSVAISDRYAVVGAPYHDDTGAVYVFKREGREWIETSKLVSGNRVGSFGNSVAIEGETIIVGEEDASCNSAYIFTLNSGNWVRQADLVPNDSECSILFGRSVALAGDYAWVGAPIAGWNYIGAVYAFKMQGNGWTAETKRVPDSRLSRLAFGSSLAFDGDRLIVGTAPHSLDQDRAAYIYRRFEGSWDEEAALAVSDVAFGIRGHGVSVHICNDTAVIGSSSTADERGAAYIFQHTQDHGEWAETAWLKGSDALRNSHFGKLVWIEGSHVYVGTGYADDPLQFPSNAVYVFRHQGDAWSEQLKIGFGDISTRNTRNASRSNRMAAANGYLLVGAEQDLKDGVPTGLAYIYITCSAHLEAGPTVIAPGTTAVLSWSTELADTCRIEPGIGSVAPNGSIQVAPSQTTTYTLHASGPYGQTSRAVTLQVAAGAPTVRLTAVPAAIDAGETTTLSWDSNLAGAVSIEPGIGAVAAHGSMVVAPPHTTTYTITASGPGGVAQAFVEVLVNVPAPTAAITADPAAIEAGQSATLTWVTTHADSVIIQPNIGMAAPGGSLQVSPAADTTYILTATGPGGTTSASTRVVVASPDALQITSPYDNAWIERPDVTVEGIFANPGTESGITVNGLLALVHGDRFVVNHVPLQDGLNTLTARAVDGEGRAVETSIVVNCEVHGNFIRIDAAPASGTPVLKTTLTVDGSFKFADAALKSDYFEPAIPLGGAPASCSVEIGSPGLYVYTAEARDEAGRLHSDKVAVLVQDPIGLDDLLQAKWNAMRANLLAGDVAGALKYYAIDSRADYEAVFTGLGDKLPQVAAGMQGIEMVVAGEGFAKYRIRRNEVHQGQHYDISYYIYFVCDDDGIWTIQRY